MVYFFGTYQWLIMVNLPRIHVVPIFFGVSPHLGPLGRTMPCGQVPHFEPRVPWRWGFSAVLG